MVLSFVLATLTSLFSVVDDSSYKKEVTNYDSVKIEERISFVSDRLTKGRLTGTPGSLIVNSYICDQLDHYGLVPLNGKSFNESFYIEEEDKVGRNIAALLPSIYPSDYYIVISANYDHLGVLGGSIFTGADKNGSGVAALLTLAEWFALLKYSRTAPHINMIFIFYDARESNMAGSKHFAKNLPIEPESIRLNINLDQMGTTHTPPGEREEYLLFLADNSCRDSGGKVLNRVVLDEGIDLEIDETFYGSESFYPLIFGTSDQIHLSRAGVPSVLFTSGINLHTNKPTDSIDKINLPVFTERIRAIYHFILKYVK